MLLLQPVLEEKEQLEVPLSDLAKSASYKKDVDAFFVYCVVVFFLVLLLSLFVQYCMYVVSFSFLLFVCCHHCCFLCFFIFVVLHVFASSFLFSCSCVLFFQSCKSSSHNFASIQTSICDKAKRFEPTRTLQISFKIHTGPL